VQRHEGIAAWYAGRLHKWAAYDRESGELVGRGGLSRIVLEGQPCLEVGWVVRPDLWGRGFASEIARAALAFGFDELGADEIVAFTERHNVRSRAVIERVGMHYQREFQFNRAPFVRYVIGRG